MGRVGEWWRLLNCLTGGGVIRSWMLPEGVSIWDWGFGWKGLPEGEVGCRSRRRVSKTSEKSYTCPRKNRSESFVFFFVFFLFSPILPES